MIIKAGIYQLSEVALAQQMEGKNPGEIKLLDYNGIISPDDRHVLELIFLISMEDLLLISIIRIGI